MTIVNAPDRVGKYRITGVVGAGVGAVVYKAFDAALQRVVAVKLLDRPLSADENAARVFAVRLREQARTVARLAHPHIVAVHEIDEADGRPFVATEYVAGPDLAQWLAAAPLPPLAALLTLMDEVLDALQAAHAAGLRHGDLTAGNVIVGPTGAKLTDFGLARALGRAGLAPGAAPELQAGRMVDDRVDVHAAGVLLYRMLAGRDPFAASASTRAPLRAPSTLSDPHRPAAFDAVVAKALAPDPDQRYASAAEFREALRDATALHVPAHGARVVTLGAPGPERAPPPRMDAFAVRRSLVGSPPSGAAAAAVPMLTIAIPDSVLSMPSFDPWARPPLEETVTVHLPLGEDGRGSTAVDVLVPLDQSYAEHRGQIAREHRAMVSSAAAAANAALDAAAQAASGLPPIAMPRAEPAAAPVEPLGVGLLTLPSTRNSPAPGGLVITESVLQPVAPAARRLPHAHDVRLPERAAPDAGIPAEALRRALKVLASHVGPGAGEMLKQVAGRASTTPELHALLVERAAGEPAIDAARLARQLKAVAKLPL